MAFLIGPFLVCSISFAQTKSEVWIGSNVGTKDLPEFAMEPQKWPTVFAVTNVFTFYAQQIDIDNPEHCSICDDNMFSKLKQKGVFQKLVDHGLRINVETGSVKDWACDGTSNIRVSKNILDRFRAMDVPLNHISMDEPFMAGEVWCKQPDTYTATKVAEYMLAVRRHWEKIFPDVPSSIGLLEPYPRHSMASIINFIKMLTAKGQKPDFFHLDFNKYELKSKGYSDTRIKQDVRKLANYLNSENIPFGSMFGCFVGESPQKNRLEMLDCVKKWKKWYGPTEHFIFQSWENIEVDGKSKNRRPDNIPESNPYSLTGIVKDALPILGGTR